MNVDIDFSEYMAARWPRLVRSAVLLGCTETEAEDLVQATLERCLMKWRMVRRAKDTDAYVHRILVNTFKTSRRRRWTLEQPTADLPDRPSPDPTARVDDVDAVMRALARLSDDQRIAVVLRFYAQLSERQMSVVLGVAPGTVKSRLSRAQTSLARDPVLADMRSSGQ